MDLRRTRVVFDHPGPFLTVHAEVGRTTEHAAAQAQARWAVLRQDLQGARVDPRLVADIGDRLLEDVPTPGPARRTIVATHDGVVFDDLQAADSRWPEATELFAPLPDLAGWLWIEDRQVMLVLAVTDADTADVVLCRALAHGGRGDPDPSGRRFRLTEVLDGQWDGSQLRRGTDDTHQHAGLVADTVRFLVRRHRPRLVVVAGDERARSEVADRLVDLEGPGTAVVLGAAPEPGGGASPYDLGDTVEQALGEVVARDDRAVAELLTRAAGRDEEAAHGVDEVLDALRAARAERVLLDLLATREMVVRPARHEGLALPAAAAVRDALPADRVLVAAAAATDAALSLLPADAAREGSVSALLRRPAE